MLINGFTVIAQAINFLILVWLLKRFLYKPILHAIDERGKGIAARLAEAESKQAEAVKEREDYQHKNEVFDQERAALLKKAVDAAESERRRLVDEATKAADALLAKRQQALESEQRDLRVEITRWTEKEVFAVTRKALADLAGVSLEERMGEVFVGRVRALAGAEKEQMAAAFKSSDHTVSIHSAYEMTPAGRVAIENAVKETFAPDAHVQFETAPEIVSGIELSTNGHKIAWSIRGYLSTLEKIAGEPASAEPKPDAKSKPGPKSEVKTGPKRETKRSQEPVSVAQEVDH